MDSTSARAAQVQAPAITTARLASAGWRLPYVALIMVTALWLVGRDMAFMRNAFVYDVFIYQCYARAFWQGPQQAIQTDRATRACAPFGGAAAKRFTSLPREYPVLALAVFSLPLLTPQLSYDAAFLWWMALILLAAVGILAWRAPPQAAPAFLLYTLLAGWQFVFARFDLVPGLVILFALVLARRGQARSAAALLAVGTLLKIMPALLLPLLLIDGYRVEGRWRVDCVAIFAAVLALGLTPAFALNPGGVWAPIMYALQRPLHIESCAGIVLWMAHFLGGDARVIFSYGSYNVLGSGANLLMAATTLLLLCGLAASYWRCWRGHDSLARGMILVLLVAIIANKVVSPQYILWLLPVAAVAEGLRVRWIIVAVLIFAVSGDGGLPFSTVQAAPLASVHAAPSLLYDLKVLASDIFLAGLSCVYLLGRGDSSTSKRQTTVLS